MAGRCSRAGGTDSSEDCSDISEAEVSGDTLEAGGMREVRVCRLSESCWSTSLW